MRLSIYHVASLLAAVSSVAAQAVKGTAYGFASGVDGGGSATAAAPASAEELASWLSDDTPRVILIDQEYDFTGTTTTDAGCDKTTCSVNDGGQGYIGDLSCGNADMVAVSSITYDAAGTSPLSVGSNKSIISSNGQGVLRGKGLSLAAGSSNVIIQGIEFVDINPKYVWGGDALELQGQNDGVWVDHCKFSLVGRMFVVSHYDAVRLTLSNNEFDGVTTTSAMCNGNHYWTMMFLGDGDQVTLDRNYFHDVSGRAPKLGQDGVTGTYQASNNYFSNMLGHAFDAYSGASALIEGNVFDGVDYPVTDQALTVDTLYNVYDDAAASACADQLGRACALNSLASSGDWSALGGTGILSTLAANSDYVVTPIEASEVTAYVTANAGPANLASYGGSGSGSDSGSGSGSGSGGSGSSPSGSPSSAPTATGSGSGATASATAKSATTYEAPGYYNAAGAPWFRGSWGSRGRQLRA